MQEAQFSVAVVDDDDSMCQALRRLLTLAGYEVRTYFSAEAFLDDPDHKHTSFLVADIQLRGMSGFDLRERFRKDRPGVPVVFITAHDDAQTRARAKASGCAAYLRKPFAGRLLLDAIASAGLQRTTSESSTHNP